MSSIPGLPTRGSNVTILITRVHLHPLCMFVEFWGKFRQDREEEYESLARDIQSPGCKFQEFEGNLCDQCLVQINDTWYRSRIVSRNGSKYSVYLSDKGITCSTSASKLAWGKKEHFYLPPEVEFCVLANVLPLSPENTWSPVALEFLRSLCGKSVHAHVQDVLVPHRMFLLHIPCISKQMYEMGFAKKLPPERFMEFVLLELQSRCGAQASPEAQLISLGAVEQLHNKELFMYPELPEGIVETVTVTEVANPQQIFCQLKVFSLELRKLSDQLTQCYEGRTTSCIVGPEMIGFPCAARGSDGKWYRCVLKQVYPTNHVVEVLSVDYGTKQIVQEKNVRPLAADFFRIPVVTYTCSLHGISDKGLEWTTSQFDYLKNLVLRKTLIAKFECQSISGGPYYVTLFGEDNVNINHLFSSKERRLLECEKTPQDYAVSIPTHSCQDLAPHQVRSQNKRFNFGKAVDEKQGEEVAEMLPAEELSLNSSHLATVQHVLSPSEFWIQTQNYANELYELMGNVYHLYKDTVNKDVVRNPTVGLYCAVKAGDGDYYRAVVSEVGETQIKMFFVDNGKTEIVDKINIRTLPDKFKKLPRLALKCALAGVRPKDGGWSKSASAFFAKFVKDKVLDVQVTAKHDDCYIIHLTDRKAHGEGDLSALLCDYNLAEWAKTQRELKRNITMQHGIVPPTQHPDTSVLSGMYRNSVMSFEAQNTVGPANSRGINPAFKVHMFTPGSVLDVSVSCIKSPNDFWCQLVQNAGHLNLLMNDLQTHYAGSDFQPFVEMACVARHPDNGMWYRALVIEKHETPFVEVLFVDYGQTETVSLYDLRRIHPEFLVLQGQAFRCSLLNPVDPTSVVNQWNDKATALFHNFVQNAASNLVILKCTISAVMYSEQKVVFNIVDLETPFERVCTSMVNVVKSAPVRKASGPSFHLDTYYYSTHNIKTGTEEHVKVTSVNSVNQFYCQLERNADVIKDIQIQVNNLCHQLENLKLPTVFGTLCFAKYTDGQWYRGQIKATKPAILVNFVDYGDTVEVDKSDLLPVPKEANDIMSVPVQAVLCGLSDVPTTVSSEVNTWFEKSATDGRFQALIVARKPDGKLLVELYYGNTQVNSNIKKMFQIKMHTEEPVSYRNQKALEFSENKTAQKTPQQATDTKDFTSTFKKSYYSGDERRDEPKPADKNPERSQIVSSQKVKAAPLELYRPPHQRQSCRKTVISMRAGSDLENSHFEQRKERNSSTDPKQLCNSLGSDYEKLSGVKKLPQLADLPPRSIAVAMEADVYVSHCNGPLSFYIQLVRDEDSIFCIAEKLNDPKSTLERDLIKDLNSGDLVQAEFAEDSSWYRAVVREIHANKMVFVEFIDFGNTAVVPVSKLRRLHDSFLQLPVYSTHCMLSSAVKLNDEASEPEVVSAFKEDIGAIGENVLKCRFIQQSRSVWEVSLQNNGLDVSCKIPSKCSTSGPKTSSDIVDQGEERPESSDAGHVPENSEELLLNSCPLQYQQQHFLEKQQLDVYMTTINDDLTIRCQHADSEKLKKVTSRISEIVAVADHKCITPQSLSSGSPCIALFRDDDLWYRAEVIKKDVDDIWVLFVDYGNVSKVTNEDVRAIPPDLVEIPPQAFPCKLEGFDCSYGSWDRGALDELSALTLDKLLLLTVTRVESTEDEITCFVQLECDGQAINEVMKTWWKSSNMESKPDDAGLSPSNGPQTQCDSAGNEAALVEDLSECPEILDADNVAAYFPSPTFQGEEKSPEELTVPGLVFEDELARIPGSRKDSVDLDSDKEDLDQCAMECSMTVGVPTVAMHHSDYDIEEDSSFSFEDKDNLTLGCDKSRGETDQGFGEKGTETIGPDDLISLQDEQLKEAKDMSETTTNSASSAEEGHNTTRSSAVMIFSAHDQDASAMSTPTEICLTRVAAEITTETDLEQPSPVLPVQQLCDPSETAMEAGDYFRQEELLCVTVDSIEHTSGHCDYTRLVFAETEVAAPEPPLPNSDDEVEEVTWILEEECLTDECIDLNEPCSDGKLISTGPDGLESLTVPEMAQNSSLANSEHEVEFGLFLFQDEVISNRSNVMAEDETAAFHKDRLDAVKSEHETCFQACPEMSSFCEQGTCPVGEEEYAEVCGEKKEEAGTEDKEQLVQTSPKQNEGSDEDHVFTGGRFSSDDGFEARLSAIIHLSLSVCDGSIDDLPIEQKPGD